MVRLLPPLKVIAAVFGQSENQRNPAMRYSFEKINGGDLRIRAGTRRQGALRAVRARRLRGLARRAARRDGSPPRLHLNCTRPVYPTRTRIAGDVDVLSEAIWQITSK